MGATSYNEPFLCYAGPKNPATPHPPPKKKDAGAGFVDSEEEVNIVMGTSMMSPLDLWKLRVQTSLRKLAQGHSKSVVR